MENWIRFTTETGKFNRMTEDNLHTKVDLENGSPAFAKPMLYAAFYSCLA